MKGKNIQNINQDEQYKTWQKSEEKKKGKGYYIHNACKY